MGLGAFWGNSGYSCRIQEHIRHSGSIVHFEMYNVVVALAMWADRWSGHVVRISSNNMAVVHAINNLQAHNAFLATCLHNALMILARHGIYMYAVHIPGVKNREADALSGIMMDFNSNRWVLEKVTLEHEQNGFLFLFFLFGVLRRFQHCTGHITTGSWKGRGNQYI